MSPFRRVIPPRRGWISSTGRRSGGTGFHGPWHAKQTNRGRSIRRHRAFIIADTKCASDTVREPGISGWLRGVKEATEAGSRRVELAYLIPFGFGV